MSTNAISKTSAAPAAAKKDAPKKEAKKDTARKVAPKNAKPSAAPARKEARRAAPRMTYSQLTWYAVAVFTLGAGIVALGMGASLTTALVRSIVTMLLFGTLGWAANIFLMPSPAQPTPQAEKGTRLDASVGDDVVQTRVAPASAVNAANAAQGK